jgi:hypothetical protein
MARLNQQFEDGYIGTGGQPTAYEQEQLKKERSIREKTLRIVKL